jgi:hypothetical protein
MAPSNPRTHRNCEARRSMSGVAQADGDSLAETRSKPMTLAGVGGDQSLSSLNQAPPILYCAP